MTVYDCPTCGKTNALDRDGYCFTCGHETGTELPPFDPADLCTTPVPDDHPQIRHPGTIALGAGPGGFEEGARILGGRALLDRLDIVGLDFSADAVATARAAGHQRVDAADADMTRYHPGYFTGTTGGIFTTPCFPAGTPVLTARGVIPIESVKVGDRVLTHRNRWRPVTALKRRHAEVLQDGPLTATAEHPFYARAQTRGYADGAPTWSLGPPRWTPAAELQGQFTAIPESPAHLPVPPIEGRHVAMDAPFWYAVGRWVGDGWLRIHEPPSTAKPRTAYATTPRNCRCGRTARTHARYAHLWLAHCSRACEVAAGMSQRAGSAVAQVVICSADGEASDLEAQLAATGLRWARTQARTVTRFALNHKVLTLWLRDHFGRGAATKTLPAWALTMPREHRQALLAGYLDADGSVEGAGWDATTVSHCLAVSVRLLATGLGYTTSIGKQERTRIARIEGRTITERPTYRVRIRKDDGRYTRSIGGHRWVKQRRQMHPRGVEPVYDLTVDEDESFVAHGFVVHNCPPFSSAAGANRATAAEQQALLDCITALGYGCDCDWRTLAERISNPIAALAVETARWAFLMPDLEWFVAEQVPGIEPMWEDITGELAATGWESFDVVTFDASTAVGLPVRRKRSYLIGRKFAPSRTALPVAGVAYIPGQSYAGSLAWEPGHRVRTRGQRRATGGNLFDADKVGWCLTEKARSWVRDADGARLTAAEAGWLRGFPLDYPWRGSRSSQFLQAADVVAPPAGAAVLGAALDVPWLEALQAWEVARRGALVPARVESAQAAGALF